MQIDKVSTDNVNVVDLDIYDATAKQVLTKMSLSRQDFGADNIPQNFRVYFSTHGRAGHQLETRVYTHGNARVLLNKVTVEVFGARVGLPKIIHQSTASPARVEALVRQAINGLGFSDQADAPNANDLIIVSNHLMAWVDQTGFVGKMNGLWKLNGAQDDSLDFVLKKGDRPLNFLITGEAGNGQWPVAYTGSEHYEFPNEFVQKGDIAFNAIKGWHSYAESPVMPDWLGHWSSCNYAKPGFSVSFAPIKVEQDSDKLEIWYEDRLVKMADNLPLKSGVDCGLDMLFQDGQRRPVYLQTGYTFYKNRPYVDRHYRLRNEAGNTTFDQGWSLIGGFVVADLKNRLPEKQFYEYFRWTNPVAAYKPKVFERLYTDWPKQDLVLSWTQRPYIASREPRVLTGQSIALSHPNMGPSSSQEDIGACLCVVHGGFEMGGSVLSSKTGGMPLAGGLTSAINTRRLWLPTTGEPLGDWE